MRKRYLNCEETNVKKLRLKDLDYKRGEIKTTGEGEMKKDMWIIMKFVKRRWIQGYHVLQWRIRVK